MRMGIRSTALLFAALVFVNPGAQAAGDSENERTDNYSMTISGGVSLGIYEAGVNWAVVETLRDRYYESGKEQFGLSGVTGASAGAINALLTAIRFCQKKNTGNITDFASNTFYSVWNIGLEQLLPRNMRYEEEPSDNSGNLADALFTRTPFAARLRRVRAEVESNTFEPGCTVDVAMIVSRSVPQRLVFNTPPISRVVPVQRFVIPLTARVRFDEERGSYRLVFENNAGYSAIAQQDSLTDTAGLNLKPHYLLLPEKNQEVPFDAVVRAALASSAFPIAFGRVQLHYCSPDKAGNSPQPRQGRCPTNHFYRSGFFIDGGVFDNIPVGTAVEMALLSRSEAARPRNHIYLDPNNTVEGLRSGSKEPDSGLNNVAQQLQVAVSTLSTLRKQQLSIDLGNHFAPNSGRNLLVSERTIPLVGTYLSGFAAFIDPAFFRHDYAAGLYDGLLNVSRYLCALNPDTEHKRCKTDASALFDRLAKRLFKPATPLGALRACDIEPCIEQQLLKELVLQFRAEAGEPFKGERSCSEATPGIQQGNVPGRVQLLSVSSIVCSGTASSFNTLVREIDANRRQGIILSKQWEYGDTFEYIADNGDERWKWGLTDHALSRLARIEDKQEGSFQTLIGTARAVLPSVESYSEDNNLSSLRRLARKCHPTY